MIFLDNNSTTKLDERVFEKMVPFLKENYGNPHSNFHNFGLISKNAVEQSRNNIAEIFNVNPENVIFTSGATESNNLILKGLAYKAIENQSSRKKIFCSSIEHKCVLETCEFIKSLGFEHELIPVDEDGLSDLNWLKDKIDDKTLFISVMTVNNETGMRSNLEEINQICKDFGVIFHSDMAQALHGEKFDLTQTQIDAISISGHKIYGPKGVGALILNHEPLEFISPISHGGLQEQDIRSGTVPVFLTVGISEALKLINVEHEKNKKYLLDLREKFVNKITNLTSDIKINYASTNGHPGTLNIHFKNVDADIIATRLANEVAVSTSAACNGVGFDYSYVLKNMHLSEEISKSSIRLCFSKYNTSDEVIEAAKIMHSHYYEVTDTANGKVPEHDDDCIFPF